MSESMELGLGTVQLGLPYGISNAEGQTSPREARRILQVALLNEMRTLDTAPFYGDSELVLGRLMAEGLGPFRVITKASHCNGNRIGDADVETVRTTFFRSLERLGLHRVAGLLIHRTEDLLRPGGDRLYEALKRLQQDGHISRIGASVYSIEDIDRLYGRYELDLIQVPLNVLDQRLLLSGHLAKLKEKGVEIHARSIFLQGLLLMDPDKLHPHFACVKHVLRAYRQFVRQHNLTPAEGALGFIRRQQAVDYAILGVNSASQLVDNINGFAGAKTHLDFTPFAVTHEEIINPTRWKIC